MLPSADPSEYEQAFAATWDHSFHLDWNDFQWSDSGRWHPEWQLDVMSGALQKSGKLVVCDGEWLPWQQVSAMFPPLREKAPVAMQHDEDEEQAPETMDIFENHPWLQQFLQNGVHEEVRENTGDDEPDHDAYDEVVDAEVVMDALMQKRQEMGLAGGRASGDFAVVLRGGPELFKRTGAFYDVVRGQCCTSEAEAFCLEWHLQRSFSVTLAAYGDDACQTMARAWVSRMQFLLDVCTIEEPGFRFTEAVMRDFEEDPAVGRLYADCSPAIRTRIAQIRKLRPTKE